MQVTGARAAFHHPECRHAVVIQYLLANKLLAPVRVLHFAAQPRGFPLIVISNTFHRAAIDVQRHKGVHHRPQAIAVDRQHHLLNLLLRVAHQINFRQVATPLNAGRILAGVQRDALLRILQRLGLIKFCRVFLQQLAGRQIHQSRRNARREGFRYRISIHPGLYQAGDGQDIALLIQRPLRLLAGFQPHGRARHHDGADQTKHQHHQQRFADAIVTFLLSHATSSA